MHKGCARITGINRQLIESLPASNWKLAGGPAASQWGQRQLMVHMHGGRTHMVGVLTILVVLLFGEFHKHGVNGVQFIGDQFRSKVDHSCFVPVVKSP